MYVIHRNNNKFDDQTIECISDDYDGVVCDYWVLVVTSASIKSTNKVKATQRNC